MRTDNAVDIRLDAMLENCIFYISPMYEFSHSLGHEETKEQRPDQVRFPSMSRCLPKGIVDLAGVPTTGIPTSSIH
jgi:hypothetical protein